MLRIRRICDNATTMMKILLVTSRSGLRRVVFGNTRKHFSTALNPLLRLVRLNVSKNRFLYRYSTLLHRVLILFQLCTVVESTRYYVLFRSQKHLSFACEEIWDRYEFLFSCVEFSFFLPSWISLLQTIRNIKKIFLANSIFPGTITLLSR